MAKKPPKPTVDRRAAFVREYLVDLNAQNAAIRAGYSAKTARAAGSRLLSDVDIRAQIDAAMKERAARVELTADDVLRELLRIARVDLADLYTENGQLKSIHEIPEDARRAIAGIEVDELWEGRGSEAVEVGVTRKVKLWDKPKALELLGKHLKLFTEIHEHRGLDRLADALATARGRVVKGQ